MPVRLGVIADDLTGANDTGVQFARRGARTIVPLDWHDLGSLARQADVLVLSTNSRALPPAAAGQRAKLAATALQKARVPAIYKKIDSTFRGNVGAELDAILDVYPVPLAILTPSFPPAGRAVVDGTLVVDGVPVHRTTIGRDPVSPVREAHLPSLLRTQSCRMIYHLPLAILRARWPRPASAVREWASAGAGVVVADAVTPDDLRRLARLIVEERLLGVATGSAGLADALGQAMSWRQKPLARISPSGRPILLVVGSANPTSLAQIVFLEEQELAAVIRVRIPAVLGEKKRVQREVDRVRHDAAAAIRSGQDAVLTLAQDEDRERPVRSRRTKVRAESPPALSSSASATLSDFLGRAAHDLTHSLRPGGLVLCGGDIAVATCRALGAKGVILGGEVQPGVPWGRLVGGERPNLPVVTKAGGFGRPDAFRAAIRFLKRPRAG